MPVNYSKQRIGKEKLILSTYSSILNRLTLRNLNARKSSLFLRQTASETLQ